MPSSFKLLTVAGRPSPVERTRARLLHKALALFAQEGLKSVSLRRIVSAAGGANPSALHYHFGDRWALVTGIAEQVFAHLRSEALPALRALHGQPHDVREVLEALYLPLLRLREAGPAGQDAVRFLARLSWEFGREGQALSGAGLAEMAKEAQALLEPLLPDRSPDEIRLQMIFTMTNVFHGMADLSYIEIVPFGPHSLIGPAHARQRTRLMFDYLEAGLRGLPAT